MQLGYEWDKLGGREGVIKSIQEGVNAPHVNAYKMLFYEDYDRQLGLTREEAQWAVFSYLGKVLAEPERYARVRRLFAQSNIEYTLASVSRPWRMGFRFVFDLPMLVSKLAKLFNGLQIKMEIPVKNELKFACYLVAEKKKTGRHFTLQVFADGGHRVLQIKNDNLALFHFVVIAKKVLQMLSSY